MEVGRGAGNEGGFLNLRAGEGGEKKNSKAKSLKRMRNTKGFPPQHEGGSQRAGVKVKYWKGQGHSDPGP